jgi:hypothetical protein
VARLRSVPADGSAGIDARLSHLDPERNLDLNT